MRPALRHLSEVYALQAAKCDKLLSTSLLRQLYGVGVYEYAIGCAFTSTT